MKKLTVLFVLIMLTVTSCVTNNPAPIVGMPRTRSIEMSPIAADSNTDTAEENRPIQIPVLYSIENAIRGIYEPTDSIYLGAWLSPGASIRDFVDIVGQRHAVFVHEMRVDEEVPVTWILQCIAALATPLIVLHPPQINDADEADLEEIEEISETLARLAQSLGAFNLPMFVVFYPHGPGPIPAHGLIPAEYALIFRQARAIFLSYAPHVAFVWAAPSLESTIRNPFFPGSDAVDWVGVSVLSHRNGYGFAADVIEAFTPFYHSFQARHPIMALPLGISHFSRADHIYHLEEAAAEITRVYQALAGFPRLGLIVYADAFGISRAMRDDFSISLESKLLAAYEDAVSARHFVSVLETNAPHGSRWVRSAFAGYLWEGQIYINTDTLTELSISLPRNTVEIGGHNFVEADRIIGRKISFCEIRQVVLMQ